ncbi:MAG: efflux RND transporter periplasmic adaptor subunit [Firmicutes bacterium]|nr:efflux RND transporter periplasmic adaptor subunit [Bacillota bacterium]
MNRIRSQKYWLLVIMAVFLLPVMNVGCEKKAPAKENGNSLQQEYPVRLSKLAEGTIERTQSYVGTLKSREQVDIRPKSSGKIESMMVQEGDVVRRGQPLIQLENKDLLAQIAQAEAALRMAETRVQQARSTYSLTAATTDTQVSASKQMIDQANEGVNQAKSSFNIAKLDFDRMKNLYDRGAISKQAYDQAQTQYDIAKSRVEDAKSRVRQAEQNYKLSQENTAQKQVRSDDIANAAAAVEQSRANIEYLKVLLDYTTITSPIDGVITEKNVEIGEIIAPGDKIASLVITDNTVVDLDIDVPEQDAANLKNGDQVKVTIDSVKDKEFVGTIKTVIPSADPAARVFRIKIAIDNHEGMLKNGMSATATLNLGMMSGLVLPRHWLMTIEGDSYVSVISEGRLKQVKVKVLFANEENALIQTNGVKAGTEIISSGHESLKEGDKVKVDASSPAPTGSPAASSVPEAKGADKASPEAGKEPAPPAPSSLEPEGTPATGAAAPGNTAPDSKKEVETR